MKAIMLMIVLLALSRAMVSLNIEKNELCGGDLGCILTHSNEDDFIGNSQIIKRDEDSQQMRKLLGILYFKL